ncbi:YihY/virulence factor BrkB family protein [bacterium]|nr:YihY/virulence factor BrkB family protein [bacterium]
MIKTIIKYLKALFQNFFKDDCWILAGAISYYSILSLIPFLLVSISVLGFIIGSSEEAISLALDNIDGLFPRALILDFRTTINSVIGAKEFFGGVGIILLLWFSGFVFDVIEKAINHVWGIEKIRGFWHRRGITYLVMILISVCALVSIFISSASKVLRSLELEIFNIKIFQNQFLWNAFMFIVPLVLVIIVFVFIYNVLPYKHIPFKYSILGGIFAGVLWGVAKWIFGWFVTNVVQYSKIYGTLGALIAIMLWIYYSSIILLFGAEIIATRMKWKSADLKLLKAEV